MEKEGRVKSNLEELRERKLNKKNAINNLKQLLLFYSSLILLYTSTELPVKGLSLLEKNKLYEDSMWHNPDIKYSVQPDNCSLNILPNSYSQKVSYLRYMNEDDLDQFGGEFPVVRIKGLSSFVDNSLKRNNFHSMELFARCWNIDSRCEAFENIENLNKIVKIENEQIQSGVKDVDAIRFELAPFEEEVTMQKYFFNTKINIEMFGGTGTFVHYKEKHHFVTAAHVIPNLPNDYYLNDVVATNLFHFQKIYKKKTSPAFRLSSLTNNDLMGQKLQMFFSRNTCRDRYPEKQYFVYDIVPNRIEGQFLTAPAPQDVRYYMKGVSGAGIFLNGEYVGTYNGHIKDPKNPRFYFTGVDAVRTVLERAEKKDKYDYIEVIKAPWFGRDPVYDVTKKLLY